MQPANLPSQSSADRKAPTPEQKNDQKKDAKKELTNDGKKEEKKDEKGENKKDEKNAEKNETKKEEKKKENEEAKNAVDEVKKESNSPKHDGISSGFKTLLRKVSNRKITSLQGHLTIVVGLKFSKKIMAGFIIWSPIIAGRFSYSEGQLLTVK